jgi:hypothetical protein
MMGFTDLPELAFFVVTIIFVLISYEVGFKFGTKRRLKPGENPETAAGTLSGTTLGLLAFMLAFTFNGAATTHHARKDLVFKEANAVRTTYQYSMAMPEPYRAKVHELLREYVDVRVNIPGLRPADIKPALERTMAIQNELWSTALTVQKNEKNVPMIGLFAESLSKVFDLHVERFETVFQSRIPSIIWVVLFLLTFITMAMMGYRIGLSGLRSTFIEVSMALSFSLVLLLILALDCLRGILQVSQKPLAEVLKMLSAGS